jgi:hypothetical protein
MMGSPVPWLYPAHLAQMGSVKKGSTVTVVRIGNSPLTYVCAAQLQVNPSRLYEDENVHALETADCLLLPHVGSAEAGPLAVLVRCHPTSDEISLRYQVGWIDMMRSDYHRKQSITEPCKPLKFAWAEHGGGENVLSIDASEPVREAAVQRVAKAVLEVLTVAQ